MKKNSPVRLVLGGNTTVTEPEEGDAGILNGALGRASVLIRGRAPLEGSLVVAVFFRALLGLAFGD